MPPQVPAVTGARHSDRPPVSPAHVEALKQLALLGGLHDAVELNSAAFGDLINASQQTASRRILELLDAGLVERDLRVKNQLLRITAAGTDVLRAEQMAYNRIFDDEATVEISGEVVSGVGEGKYYLSQDGYTSQFLDKLGFEPFPGTLNIELSGLEANKLRLLKARPSVVIEGFQTGERTFGGVLAWRATLEGVPCAAILPNRTHYTKVIEVIAPEHLRTRLGLEDHSMVRLEVEVEP